MIYNTSRLLLYFLFSKSIYTVIIAIYHIFCTAQYITLYGLRGRKATGTIA